MTDVDMDGPEDGSDPQEQCWECGKWNPSPVDDPWPLETIDTDPGDPEVGPRPNIIDVTFCPECRNRR